MSALRPARLFTNFGTVIYLDRVTGALRHGDIDTSPANLFLAPGLEQGAPQRGVRLMTDEDGRLLDIHCTLHGCHVDPEGRATSLDIFTLERGLFGLRVGAKFLCAEPGGHIALSREVCSTWEVFLASEIWCCPSDATNAPSKPALYVSVDWASIRRFQVNPFLRARTGLSFGKKRILVYANVEWSNGRVYYDVCTALYREGYIADLLNWRESYKRAEIQPLLDYYERILTGLDGIHALVDFYDIPYERIIGLSHGIAYDLPVLSQKKGLSTLDALAGFGVVSYSMISDALSVGARRLPQVATLGVFCDLFDMPLADRLEIVGYATSMSYKYYGEIEVKRGYLAEAATRGAGLAFLPAGSHDQPRSFHDMPRYYEQVGAILMTSLVEPAGLPVLEAAAAGRLVIGTPTGHFPMRAYLGAGILAPLDGDAYVSFCTDKLSYFKNNPGAYTDACLSIKENARTADWSKTISDWIALIES